MTPNNYLPTGLRRQSEPLRAPYPSSRAWLLAGLGLLLGSQAWAQSLDPTFGTGGKVNTTFTAAPTTDMANGAALMADGRIVAVGTGSGGFNLARYMPDGSLDPTFGTGGKVTTNFSTSSSQSAGWAGCVLVQPDGKVVAAGRRDNQLIVARYTAAGALDNTFGTGGSYIWTPSSLGGSPFQIALQSTGNIVVFGYWSTLNGQHATIFSLTPNGTPIGLFTVPWFESSTEYARAMDGLVDGSDRILAVGYLDGSGPGTMRMTRWLADRTNDASFGTNGQVTLTVAAAPGSLGNATHGLGVGLQPDGKILVVGTTTGSVSGSAPFTTRTFLARYNVDGTLDNSFGTNGISLFSGFNLSGNGYRAAVDVQALANGKILVRGASNADFAVAQFNADGTPDTSFGTNGVFRVDEGPDDQLNELLVQPDGNYVGVGYSTGATGKQFTLLRLTPAAAPFVWTGAASSNWTDAGNWSGGQVPGLTDNATIPAGLTRYPVFSTSQSIGGVTISSGATLTQTGGTLTLNGAFANAGTFSQTGGTLALGGATQQSLGGGTTTVLRELAVGAAGATLAGPVQVQRLLTLTGDLATNGNLTLLSNARGTALVVNNGGTATGLATVQRYLADSLNAGRGYRHLSAPVTGGFVSQLGGSGTPPTVNPAYNSAANPSGVSPYPTVFSYEQQRLSSTNGTTSAFDYGWVSPDALSDVLQPGKGYTVNLAPQTISFRGGLFNGPLTLTLPRGATAGSGWHLIGNPYPAPINWDLTTRSGLDRAMYVYRSTGPYAGGYVSYVNGIGTPGANIISEGQAFFVRTSSAAAPGTVSFANAARLTTPQNNLVYRTQNTRPLLVLGLRAPGATDAQSDQLYVYREAGASTGFDTAYDALKVQLNGGQQPTLFQLAGTERLAIQGVPDDQQPLDLPLGLNAPTAGTYELAPEQLANFPASTTLYLEDRQTGTWHDLRTGRYAAQLPAGLSTARFVLHLGVARPLATATKTGLKLAVYPNPAPGGRITVEAAGLSGGTATLQLVNSLGQVVHHQQLPLSGAAFLRQEVALPGIKAGLYSLRIVTGSGTLAQPLVVY